MILCLMYNVKYCIEKMDKEAMAVTVNLIIRDKLCFSGVFPMAAISCRSILLPVEPFGP